ncbi:hypothetical protein Angca_003265, partial [Angiostrongylus cantonensis]
NFPSGHNVAAGARNINAALGDGFVNEGTIRRWYIGTRSLNPETRSLQMTSVAGQKLRLTMLRALVESDPRQMVREFAAVFEASAMIISGHLHLIGEVKKNRQMGSMRTKRKTENSQRLEICNSLLIRIDRDTFSNRITTWYEKWI